MTDRPTPAQARLLRALEEHPYTRVAYNHRGCQLIGPDYWKIEEQLKAEGVHLRTSSLRVVTSRGWLEPEEAGSDFYRLSDKGREALSELEDDDFISLTPSLSAEDVHLALRAHFDPERWGYWEEVHIPGWNRRVDALALRTTAGLPDRCTKYLTVWALEIKVSRSDFLAELKDREKRLPAEQLAHCYAFAAPAGMIKAHELPEGTGLLEIRSRSTVTISVLPELTRPERPTWELVASLARAAERMVA